MLAAWTFLGNCAEDEAAKIFEAVEDEKGWEAWQAWKKRWGGPALRCAHAACTSAARAGSTSVAAAPGAWPSEKRCEAWLSR